MLDSEIISLYQNRNEAAIEHSASKYGAYCNSIARGMLSAREDCEECVSDTWLQAWRAIPPTLPKSLRAFLGRITRNNAINRLESLTAAKRGSGEAPLLLSELEECVPSSFSTEGEVQARALGESVDKFLRTLSLRERGIFLSRYFKCMGISEVAQHYDMGQPAVKSQLHRTRKKLLEHLYKEDFLS